MTIDAQRGPPAPPGAAAPAAVRSALPRARAHHLRADRRADLVRLSRELVAHVPGDRDRDRRRAGRSSARSTASGRTWRAPTYPGISVGILVRSPAFWPYALCSAISITSKYVLRVGERHIWNPTNFGIVAMLLLAADTVAGLSVQWGNNLLPMVFVWVFGSVILRMVDRLHITADLRRVVPALRRASSVDHGPSGDQRGCAHHRADVSALHLLHDHRPEDHGAPEWAQSLVVFLIAAVEAVFRLMQFVYAPFYALFIVGPIANLIEIGLTKDGRSAQRAASRSQNPPLVGQDLASDFLRFASGCAAPDRASAGWR